MKRQAKDLEKIFIKYISNEGLVSRMYKEHSKLNSAETNNPIWKWAKDMNRRGYTDDRYAHGKMFSIFNH